MILKFNVKGQERKELVKAIERITGETAKYMGVPSCAYRIGEYEVSKDGEFICDDEIDLNKRVELMNRCVIAGFKPEGWEEIVETEMADATVSIPMETLTDSEFEKLENLIKAKGYLIKKALGTESLEIGREDEKVSFPWIRGKEPAEINAITKFISALCEMARTQKRINDKEKTVENEKYAFRCFLLRLGFIGDEFKQDRKILLKNFTGSSAFRDGGKKDVSR